MKKILVTILTLATVYSIAPVASAMTKTPWNDGSKPVISINNDALTTEIGDVKLSLHMVNAEEMIVANDAGFLGSNWQPYKTELDWKIWTDVGSQYVHVMFRNAYGTSEQYKDTIFYKTPISTNRKTLQEWIAVANGTATIEGSPITTISTNPFAESTTKLPAGITSGMLLKAKNGSIYYVGLDHKRHTYPNEAVYFSWNQGWGGVADASDAILSQIPLGKNMVIRPGTHLIKIQSDPKVYAVDANGTLRWIKTAEIASTVYGTNWEKRIIDLNVTQFADYISGKAIETTEYLNGLIVRDASNKNFKVENNTLLPLTTEGFQHNDYQERFVITSGSALKLPVATTVIKTWETGSLPTNTLLALVK